MYNRYCKFIYLYTAITIQTMCIQDYLETHCLHPEGRLAHFLSKTPSAALEAFAVLSQVSWTHIVLEEGVIS